MSYTETRTKQRKKILEGRGGEDRDLGRGENEHGLRNR